ANGQCPGALQRFGKPVLGCPTRQADLPALQQGGTAYSQNTTDSCHAQDFQPRIAALPLTAYLHGITSSWWVWVQRFCRPGNTDTYILKVEQRQRTCHASRLKVDMPGRAPVQAAITYRLEITST